MVDVQRKGRIMDVAEAIKATETTKRSQQSIWRAINRALDDLNEATLEENLDKIKAINQTLDELRDKLLDETAQQKEM